MKTTALQTITFGREGNAEKYQGNGWCWPEDGFTWASGTRSELSIIDVDGPLLMEIQLRPYLPEVRPYQNLFVKVGGVIVASQHVTRWATLGFILPSGGRIEFVMPNAIRPSETGDSPETRSLAFSFLAIDIYAIGHYLAPPRLPLPGSNIFSAFESIGDNCEFGLVQRKSGIEPLGLLRWSGQPLFLLVEAFKDRFTALNGIVRLQGGEFGVAIPSYGMWYHTFQRPPDATLEAVQSQQDKRLAFLRQKLLSDIEDGEKILVYKQNTRLTRAEILPLFAAIWRVGAANLLVVQPSDDIHPVGSIEVVMPGLFIGYVAQFGAYGCPYVTNEMQSAWKRVCESLLEIR